MKEKKEGNDITENKSPNRTIRENTREVEREEILNEGDTCEEENSRNIIAEEEIDRLVAASPKLRSKRVAAADGQIRRRILKQIWIGPLTLSNGGSVLWINRLTNKLCYE